MAIAGRVAIVPKGEYSNAVTYDKLDLVMFNNDAYVAKKASTGIEPTNNEYWMLILNNVVAEDLENIINGTTPVGKAKDADTVDGLHASSFVQNIVVSSENKTDDPNTTEKSRIRTRHTNCPTADVEYIIDTTFTDSTANNYERRQTAYGTGGNNVVYNRAKQYGGAWSAWKKVNGNADSVGGASLADIQGWVGANYLPLSGGTVVSNKNTPLSLENTSNTVSVIDYLGQGKYLGGIGFGGVGTPMVFMGDGGYQLLHTGNKPSGTYTGTGASRTISTGNGVLGATYMIRAKGSENFALVTSSGNICKQGSSIVAIDGAYSSTDSLVLNTNSAMFNANGTVYEYYAL